MSYPDARDILFALIPLAAVVGVFIMMAIALAYQGRVREMQIKERIALIEKGIVPPPELERPAAVTRARMRRYRASQQFITIGVTFIGIGLAVGIIIATTAEQVRVGYGIGGAIAVFGLALVANGLIVRRGPVLDVVNEGTLAPPAGPTQSGPDRDAGGLAG